MTEATILTLSGATRLFGIIGDPIQQSLSPQSVSPLLQQSGIDAILVPLHVPAGRFSEALAGLKVLHNFDGAMITYPFKAEALAMLDVVQPTARLVGAVNAIRREEDGSWSGDIFDGRGLVAGLEEEGVSPEGRHILLLGAGGAGSAIAVALAQAGCTSLTVFDLDQERVSRLIETISAIAPSAIITSGPANADTGALIVNATPMGMLATDPLPIGVEQLDPSMVVFDIVPRDDTPLLVAARQAGCHAIDYKAMARGQYAAIARFFLGQ